MRLLLCLLTLISSLCPAALQPNIIIHFIDNLGYSDIGPFGAVKQKAPSAAPNESGKRFATKLAEMQKK